MLDSTCYYSKDKTICKCVVNELQKTVERLSNS